MNILQAIADPKVFGPCLPRQGHMERVVRVPRCPVRAAHER